MAAPILAELSAASGWVSDHHVAGPPAPQDIVSLAASIDLLGAELAGAQSALGATAEEILLTALARTVARTIGDGLLAVDITDGLGNRRQVSISCLSQRYLRVDDLLAETRAALNAEFYPSATAEVLLNHGAAPTTTSEVPGPTHLLALHVHPDAECADVLHVDWRYDRRSLDRCTIEELSEQFPLSLIEVTSG